MAWESSEVSALSACLLSFSTSTPAPHWAHPIKSRIRQSNQARAINDVVNALKPSQDSAGQTPLLRVVNGISTTTNSSIITTAARENVPISAVDGLPGRSGNYALRGLSAHLEVGEHENGDDLGVTALPELSSSPRPITPSLATLEKAVSARIYFENLYFPLLRQPPSREQRRVAMEKDMVIMRLGEDQKEALRARWRQNETEYLRERRRKVDATGFIKLKTIGHGWLPYVPEMNHSHRLLSIRRIWGRVPSERTNHGTIVRH